MHIIIALTVFFIVLMVIAFVKRNNTLKKFPWEPGETILKEFTDLKVTMKSLGPRTAVFSNSKISITNQRALVCQKLPLRDDFVIHYIFYPQQAEVKSLLKRGIVELNLNPDEIHPPGHPNDPLVLRFPGSSMIDHITINSAKPDQLVSSLKEFAERTA